MSEADLDRVRADLATVRQAAGLELPFGREDVWVTWYFVPATLFISVYAPFGPIVSHYGYIVLLPVLAGMACSIWLRYHYRRSTGRSVTRRKEYTFELLTGLIVMAAALFYMRFAGDMGVSRDMAGFAALFFAGVITLVLAVSAPGRRCLLPGAACLMLWGFLVPVLSVRPFLAAGGVLMALSAVGAALIMQYQLRRHEAHDAAD